jgi:hypothetical protein
MQKPIFTKKPILRKSQYLAKVNANDNDNDNEERENSTTCVYFHASAAAWRRTVQALRTQ